MPILMYHRVAGDGPASLARWRVSPPAFEQQMAYLAENDFRPVALSDWLEAQDGDGDTRRRAVALTFDDAYLDFITTALPVLRRRGFGATMFVPTQFIGGHADWDVEFGDPAPLMSWEQLADAADAGIEIGAHTLTHPRLPQVGREQMQHEIADSRRILEDKFGRPVRMFAYPYGEHDQRVRDAVAEANFTAAVTITQKPWTNLSLMRVEIAGGDTIETFASKLSG